MPQTSGHWIGDKPVLAEDISKHPVSAQREATLSYLSGTHMNMQHQNMETLERRAMAHQNWNATEERMLQQTESALQYHQSPHFQLSSHMIHNERRLLADRANSLREKDKELANSHLSAQVDLMTGPRAQGIGNDYNSLTEMLIHGKQGPLTEAQSRLGVEAVVVGQYAYGKPYAKDNPRIEAIRPKEDGDKRSHPSVSRYGVNLSQDAGSKIREAMGLPVMMGTSGSSSDVARSYQFTETALTSEMTPSTAMPAHQHSDVLTDLAFHWMRAKAPVTGVKSGITELEKKHDLQRAVVPPKSATQTHTFAEVAAGIDLTLDKKMSLKDATSKSLVRMTEIKYPLRMSKL
jgi:hypothetical protein